MKEDNWQKIIEGGQVFYVNDSVGNILKSGESAYIGLVPKMVKFGPFQTLEEAKSAMEQNQKSLNELLDNFNDQLINFSETVRVK